MADLIVHCVACGIEVKFPDIDLTSKKDSDNIGIKMRSTLCEACTILNMNDEGGMDLAEWIKGAVKQGEIGFWQGVRWVKGEN